MNNKAWQQELQDLTLSEDQKKNMKDRVLEQPRIESKKQWNWPVIIAPAFILLLAFCVMLIVTNSSGGTHIHQASQLPVDQIVTDHTKYIQLHTLLSLAISIGIILNGFMGILIIMKTQRWQQRLIQKLRNIIYKSRYVLTFLAPFLLYSFAVIASLVLLSEQAKIIAIYLLVIIFTFLCILFAARHQRAYVCCPHCQHEFSENEKRKLMLYFKIQLHCLHCGGKLFYGKKTRQASGVISSMMSALLIFPGNFGVPFWVIITCGIMMGFTILVVLLPLFLELEGEEKPLF